MHIAQCSSPLKLDLLTQNIIIDNNIVRIQLTRKIKQAGEIREKRLQVTDEAISIYIQVYLAIVRTFIKK